MCLRINCISDLICIQGKQWVRTIFHEQKESLLASSHEKIPFLKCSNLQMIVIYYLLTTSCVLSAIKNKKPWGMTWPMAQGLTNKPNVQFVYDNSRKGDFILAVIGSWLLLFLLWFQRAYKRHFVWKFLSKWNIFRITT